MTEAIAIRPTFLIAHDFSECADAAADLALEDLLATRRGGKLVLVHLVPTVALPIPLEGGFVIDVVAIERAAIAAAQDRLGAIATRLRAVLAQASPPPIEIECVARVGSPAEGILAESDAQRADRIVVGTHGRRGVTHMLLGSVAERVARRANVPVVIAHAPKRESAA